MNLPWAQHRKTHCKQRAAALWPCAGVCWHFRFGDELVQKQRVNLQKETEGALWISLIASWVVCQAPEDGPSLHGVWSASKLFCLAGTACRSRPVSFWSQRRLSIRRWRDNMAARSGQRALSFTCKQDQAALKELRWCPHPHADMTIRNLQEASHNHPGLSCLCYT